MLKKTTIAVLGLAASGFAAAGTMGPVCTPGNVTVPCVTKAWELGADALYLRPIFGPAKGYQQVVTSTAPVVGIVTSSATQDIKNDWNWGYRIMGAYHFNTGNDVTVNWMHISTTADQNNIVFPLVASPITVVELPANYSNRSRLDQVNVVMGQHADFGMRKKMRFYAGMQYANIQSTGQTYLIAPVTFPTIGAQAVNVFDNTDYKGFGPSVGIDYSYDLYRGLSVTANGSGSILYGTSRFHEGLVATNLNVILDQNYASKKAIVPSLEAKLGLNYAYSMADGVINIDAGYQVVNYFNPLYTQELQTLHTAIKSVNYGAFGPYFGMKYVGKV